MAHRIGLTAHARPRAPVSSMRRATCRHRPPIASALTATMVASVITVATAYATRCEVTRAVLACLHPGHRASSSTV